MHQVKSGFSLNVLFNISKAITVRKSRSEMLCCNVKFIFLQHLIIRSKFCSDVFKENYCLIKVYFVPDQFSVNGFCLFFVFLCCLFLIPCQFFPCGGEFDLKIFPRGWRFWYDLIRAFVKSPYLSRVWGGGWG